MIALAGCGGDDGEESKLYEPSVELVAPRQGDALGGAVTAVVRVEGFRIDPDALGGPNVEAAGHLRFTMDRGRFDFPEFSGASGRRAWRLGVDGQYSVATRPRITYTGLPPGEHTLIVDLVNNDHSVTGVSDAISFTVE